MPDQGVSGDLVFNTVVDEISQANHKKWAGRFSNACILTAAVLELFFKTLDAGIPGKIIRLIQG